MEFKFNKEIREDNRQLIIGKIKDFLKNNPEPTKENINQFCRNRKFTFVKNNEVIEIFV